MRYERRKILVVLCVVMLFFSTIANGSIQGEAAKKNVALNKKKITLSVGKNYCLKVKNNKKKVTWSSSQKKVATVSKKGVVKAIKKGTAKITANVEKKKYICTVKVLAKKVNQTPAKQEVQQINNTPKFLSFKNLDGEKINDVRTLLGKITLCETKVLASDKINKDEILFLKLSYENKERDSIVEIIINDSDYGNQQIYTTSASINKIVSADTHYNQEKDCYITDVLLKMPKTKSLSERKIEVVETSFLRESLGVKGIVDLSVADTTIVTMQVSATPLPSYAAYFNFVQNESGYTVLSLKTDYELPSTLYIPQQYNGLPVNQIGNQAFDKASMSTIIFPDTISQIGSKAFNSTALNLTKVQFNGQTAPVLLGDLGLNGRTKLYIPVDSYSNYAKTRGWSSYADELYYDVNGQDVQYVYDIIVGGTVKVSEGKTHQLTVRTSPMNASVNSIQYTTLNSEIATVDENGTIHAITPGKATIKVSVQDSVRTIEKDITVEVECDEMTYVGEVTYPIIEDFSGSTYKVGWSIWDIKNHCFSDLNDNSVCSSNEFVDTEDGRYFSAGGATYGVNFLLDNRNSEDDATFKVSVKVKAHIKGIIGINGGGYGISNLEESIYYYGPENRNWDSFYASKEVGHLEWDTITTTISVPAGKFSVAGIRGVDTLGYNVAQVKIEKQ